MKVEYIEVCGFRSYGAEPQRVDLNAPLTVIHADNSQGKTSFAEAIEFLYTGTTSRRQLGGGSPGEFDGALRNAHVDATFEVYVEASIAIDGDRRILRRQLVTDYQGAADCVSVLTLDGVSIDSIEAAGVQLSDPPLAAPVLLEHGLRYAVSAKPGERSDYFKAVLEVADLDLLRKEIASVVADREAQEKHPLVLTLDGLRSDARIGEYLTRASTSTSTRLVSALTSALNVLFPGEGNVEGTAGLDEAVERVKRELEVRQSTVLPIWQLRPVASAQPQRRIRMVGEDDALIESSAPALADRVDGYNMTVQNVDASVAKVLPLFQAVVELDTVPQHDGDEPADCPVCETPGSLSAGRVEAIRQQVADQEGLTQERARLRDAISQVLDDLAAIRDWAAGSVPLAAEWTDDDRSAYQSLLLQLQPEAMDAFAASHAAAVALKTSAAIVAQRVDGLAPGIERVYASTSALTAAPLDPKALKMSEAGLRDALGAHETLLGQAVESAETLHRNIAPMLAERSNTHGWAEVLALGEDSAALWTALKEQRATDAATIRLKKSQRTIANAIADVIDQKLETMAGEIRKWWSLMRPDELTVFDRLTRRGAGNRYLDLTASLIPQPSSAGVVRSALAVLSNSQLNALGLAAFLARCHLLGSTVIFLDDPVPGSDREHRYTFAQKVTSELLATGRQVVLTTHDAELARSLQTLHQHVEPGEYAATLMDPRRGTQIVRTGDDFERLMLSASAQMNSPLLENRRAAGNSLRIATERLAKLILVAERKNGGEVEAYLSDYDGKNLRELRPLVIERSKAPNEPGQWSTLARILNDSDHDTDPPQPADLKTCYDMLREIKRRHNVRSPSVAPERAA